MPAGELSQVIDSDAAPSHDVGRTEELAAAIGARGTAPALVWASTSPQQLDPAERDHYGAALAGSERRTAEATSFATRLAQLDPSTFGVDPAWVSDVFAADCQQHAYRLLRDRLPDVVVQLGGRGGMAAAILHGLAECRVVLATPIVEEALHFATLVDALGASDRAGVVLTTAEGWPFAPESLDAVVSAGSVHHVDVGEAMPRVARSLRDAGVFCSWDIWGSPLYRLGIRLAGKHEDFPCRPLDDHLVAAAVAPFRSAEVTFTGGFVRYPLGVYRRLGRGMSPERATRLLNVDRRLARTPLTRWSNSIVQLTCTEPRR